MAQQQGAPLANVVKAVEGKEWREELKHVEPHKDASAPKIPADVKLQTGESHGTLLREVSAADWRGDLKHVEPSKDASAPRIEAGVSLKQIDREALVKGVENVDWRDQLKHVEPAKDASAPVIPADASVKVPDVAGAKSAVKAVEGKEWREDLKHVQPHKDASEPKISAVNVPGPRARESLFRAVETANWRSDLKHVQPAKDASEPKIESWVKVHKVDRVSFLEEVKKADWREDLKHVQPSKDASVPRTEGWAKLQSDPRGELLKQVSNSDWREDLKHTQPTKDSSAPQVPNASFDNVVAGAQQPQSALAGLVQEAKAKSLQPASGAHGGHGHHHGHHKPQPDKVLQDIADYVCDFDVESAGSEVLEVARYALIDAIGCGILALQFPECTKLLGPIVPGTIVPNGSRVPGTNYELDPVTAAFNMGAMIRWLDYNDTWLAAEWGHPSDNLCAILAVADYLSRRRQSEGVRHDITMKDVLHYLVKAYEIQGCLALENSFNRVGIDHVVLVKVASTAVVTHMLGGTRQDIVNAVSNAWVDGQSLRTYRHAPNTGSRKSWAAGDAAARAVRLGLMSVAGEMGYPTALSAATWGFYASSFRGNEFRFQRAYGAYVMQNVLFKVSFPAEFHAQTAVECALHLHSEVAPRLADIKTVTIHTHQSAIRIIDKKGPLHNPADRDHCIQYMTAVALIHGDLRAEHYEDSFARDPRIDELRAKMVVIEDERYSRDYYDPAKRSIANALQVQYGDGSVSDKVECEYPLGHRMRRLEAIPQIINKFLSNMRTRYTRRQLDSIREAFASQETFEVISVPDFMRLLVKN